jgi:hypothetical protein
MTDAKAPKERKDNAGALFRADKKGVAKRPDYSGRVKIAGVEYWLSGWVKQHDGVAGGSYISLAFRPIEEGAAEATPF